MILKLPRWSINSLFIVVLDVDEEIPVRQARYTQVLVQKNGFQSDAWDAIENSGKGTEGSYGAAVLNGMSRDIVSSECCKEGH